MLVRFFLVNYLGVEREKTVAETMLSCLPELNWLSVEPSETFMNVVRLHSIHVGKLKYGYTDAFGYNKCKLDFTLWGAFMARCMKGEIKV